METLISFLITIAILILLGKGKNFNLRWVTRLFSNLVFIIVLVLVCDVVRGLSLEDIKTGIWYLLVPIASYFFVRALCVSIMRFRRDDIDPATMPFLEAWFSVVISIILDSAVRS